MGLNYGSRHRWLLACTFVLALGLRGYRLTGNILDHDEAHWLFYALDQRALFEKVANSLPRPDVLFPLALSVPLHLFGPNELSMRVLPVLFGALSILPMAWWVRRETGSETTALTAALFLAVQPLHVCISSLGEPDSIAFFFLLTALVFLARIRQRRTKPDWIGFGACIALALLAKGTALYFWVALLLMGPKLLKRPADRRDFYVALVVAVAPLMILTALVKQKGLPLTFINEASLGFHHAAVNLGWLLVLLVSAYEAILIAAAWGMARSWRSGGRYGPNPDQRRSGSLIWLVLLGIVLAAAPFRAFARDLIFLMPAICLFAADAVDPTTGPRRFLTAVLAILLLVCALWGMWLPGALSVSAGLPPRTGIARRPPGWPSRDAARWLLSNTDPGDAVLITTFSYPDPLQIEVRAQRRLGVAWNHWDWLQDPAQRVRFTVFVGDVGDRAPSFVRYAESHFRCVPVNFTGYTIYDCRENGRFVAYGDALSSADEYVRRGVRLLEQKRCEEAIQAFTTALEVDPDATDARRDLMVAFVGCGRKDDAVRIGTEILRRDPGDRPVNADLAILYLELGRVDAGLEQCRKNIRLGIAPAVSYGVLGQLLEKKGDFPAARDAYATALSFDPTNQTTIRLFHDVQTRLQAMPAH
jgi:hypothetical protein